MNPVVRFAPSPTGFLHIGNARTALLNGLYALRHQGRFILRLDDTDKERSKQDYADAIVKDLAWLGIQPHAVEAQSRRFALYDAAVEQLKAQHRLYPCFETADELERRRKRQMARGLPPVYDRAALQLTAGERAALEAEGRQPHWRFLLEPERVTFDDLVRGRVEVDPASLSDPVLVRADGSYLYTLPSVVDDLDMGITHVIRGEDHIVNTGVQIQIFKALSGSPPLFAHHNLLTTASGEGLSKRTGALSLHALRDNGIEPMAIASLAVLIGSSETVDIAATLEELAHKINFAAISHGAAKFDPEDLPKLNARFLQHLSYEDAQPRLKELGLTLSPAQWLVLRHNITRLSDLKLWLDVVQSAAHGVITDPDFIATAAGLLPLPPHDETTWRRWTEAVKNKTGRKGRELFLPLRLALTGQEHGPDMGALLALMSPELIQAKLRATR